MDINTLATKYEELLKRFNELESTVSSVVLKTSDFESTKLNRYIDEGSKQIIREIATGGVTSITGTANQITASSSTGAVTLSLPQDIATTSLPQFSRLGLGASADSSAKMKVSGQYYSIRYDAGNSSTSKNISWNDGNCQLVTLTGNCTLTFSAPKDGARYLLELKQDGTGSRTVTWPATVKFPSAASPVLTTTAGQTDIVSLYYNGTNYAATYSLDFAI